MIKTKFFVESEDKFGISIDNVEGVKFFSPRILLKSDQLKNDFEQLKLLKGFIKILKSYANSKSEDISFFRKENQSTSLDIIEAYLNIVNDYIENGDFVIFSKKSKKDKNHINWSKTIRDNEVIIQDNDILYGSFRSNTKQLNRDDLFFKIYMNCLADAHQLFINPSIDIENVSINNEEACYYINKYMDSHYKDRELFIAKQLRTIYSDRNFSSVNEESFSVKYHEYFEHIFQFLIENSLREHSIKKDRKKWYGYYEKTDKSKKVKGLDLRTDHLIKLSNKYYIIDSKFYMNYNFNEQPYNLPLTGDIIKQVGYKLYFSKIFNIQEKDICNVFIFPKNDFSKNENAKYFATHLVDNDTEDMFKIKCIYIDINLLIDSFVEDLKLPILLESISS